MRITTILQRLGYSASLDSSRDRVAYTATECNILCQTLFGERTSNISEMFEVLGELQMVIQFPGIWRCVSAQSDPSKGTDVLIFSVEMYQDVLEIWNALESRHPVIHLKISKYRNLQTKCILGSISEVPGLEYAMKLVPFRRLQADN